MQDITKESTIKKEYSNDVQTLSTIILAIETNNKIAFEYKKEIEFSKIRKVLPHNLYWNSDNTKVMLDGYQESGDTKSGVYSFKQFDCKFIESIIIIDEKFHIQKGYNSKSDRYKNCILGIL